MQVSISNCLAVLPILCLTDCASVDNDVKVPPGSFTSHVLFMDPQKDPTKPSVTATTEAKLEWLMPLVEIDTEGFIHPLGIRVKDPGSEDKSPVYIAYDISKIEMGQFDVLFPGTSNGLAADQTVAAVARNTLVKRVLYLSDKNFDSYTLRSQTYNDGEKLASDSLNTVGTATIGGTALIAPPAAAGIALAKLLTDSTYTNVQNSFLGGQTIDALFKAMAANRDKFKTQMVNKLFATNAPSSYDSYPIIDVLGDFRELNRISTLHGALDDISQTASTQVQAADATADLIKTKQTSEPQTQLMQNLSVTPSNAVKTQ